MARSCVRVELVEGVRIVHLDGCATDESLTASLDELGEHRGPTILDLADVTLVGAGLDRLLDRVIATSEAACIIARRQTARLILHRTGVAARCAVFASAGDALQALRLAEDGYGTGWRLMTDAGDGLMADGA